MRLSWLKLSVAGLVALTSPAGKASASAAAFTNYKAAGDIARRIVVENAAPTSVVHEFRRLGGITADGAGFYRVIAAARDAGILTRDTTNWTEIAKIAYTERFADNDVVLASISRAATVGEPGETKHGAYDGSGIVPPYLRHRKPKITQGLQEVLDRIAITPFSVRAHIVIDLPAGDSPIPEKSGFFRFIRHLDKEGITVDDESIELVEGTQVRKMVVEGIQFNIKRLMAYPGLLWAGLRAPTEDQVNLVLALLGQDPPNIHPPKPGVDVAPNQLEEVRVLQGFRRGNAMPGPGPRPALRTTLHVEVMSNGCTKAEDFEVRVTRDSKGQVLSIVRTRPDNCEVPPHWIPISLHTTSLRMGTVRLGNPPGGEIDFIDQVAH